MHEDTFIQLLEICLQALQMLISVYQLSLIFNVRVELIG